jgi:hypothetical protein
MEFSDVAVMRWMIVASDSLLLAACDPNARPESHAVAPRHAHRLHLATPAMATFESSIPPTPRWGNSGGGAS